MSTLWVKPDGLKPNVYMSMLFIYILYDYFSWLSQAKGFWLFQQVYQFIKFHFIVELFVCFSLAKGFWLIQFIHYLIDPLYLLFTIELYVLRRKTFLLYND